MGEIITITDFFLYKRNMRMTTEKNQNIILDLHQKGSYDEMPANADKLLALFPESNYPVPVIGIAKELGFKVFEDAIYLFSFKERHFVIKCFNTHGKT